MNTDLIKDPEFKQWLADLKIRIRQSQIKAMIRVNDEMLRLYRDLGHDIVRYPRSFSLLNIPDNCLRPIRSD